MKTSLTILLNCLICFPISNEIINGKVCFTKSDAIVIYKKVKVYPYLTNHIDIQSNIIQDYKIQVENYRLILSNQQLIRQYVSDIDSLKKKLITKQKIIVGLSAGIGGLIVGLIISIIAK